MKLLNSIVRSRNSPLILASNSPRRRELLKQIGLDFIVDPADVDESILPGETPEVYAVRVALDKARAAASRTKNGIVIGADTIVVLDNMILGKPKDSADAAIMLRMLSGKVHRVVTGLAIVDAASGKMETRVEITNVLFRNLSERDIASYVATGEPLDKAGAYGIQGKGALLINRIEGCYFNVVGLPLAALYDVFVRFGVEIWRV